MLVSWNWLKQYVPLTVSVEEFERRLTLAGLNHEETTQQGSDFAIDLEVTSNRPDCLGHIGIAREAAVVFNTPLALIDPQPVESSVAVSELSKVTLNCPALCYRYTARVIRGVKIQSSPPWMLDRLATIGIAAINNIVDITNYVLLECGQPLHAFDFQRLDGREIFVREARQGEKFEAINHKSYELSPGMCVIADRTRPVALGGVMGGADTEVGNATTDVLIEAAEFDPLSIRTTARKLVLHSDSSYRFERGLDPNGLDWASRRCCELILELAGGQLAAGAIDVGRTPPAREPIILRLSQLRRILGIDIDVQEVLRILTALGNKIVRTMPTNEAVEAIPPSWRRDLTREIDLVEEVARIHGYDAIPEDVSVPMSISSRTDRDRVLGKVRESLVAAGIDEAMTISVVDEGLSKAFSPWTDAPPITASTPILRGADQLRRSLVPSLLQTRRVNEAIGNLRIELFEIARIYLPQASGLPDEPLMLAIASGGDYLATKGIVEVMVERLNAAATVEAFDFEHSLLTPGRASELRLGGKRLGFVGEVAACGQKLFELRSTTTIAELQLSMLEEIAELIPRSRELSPYPSVARDLNLVVDERIRWADLLDTVQSAAGSDLERVEYRDTYRDPQRLGAAKKSQLFSVILRKTGGTLTSAEADVVRDKVVAACAAAHGAALRV
ncbi:MAG: phenylalanine--tRNA ligase subunit beta [Pirellulales bacterium]|nr:phenylalanine--tRNA ligase subunit beta [Pirellulales bacterium]